MVIQKFMNKIINTPGQDIQNNKFTYNFVKYINFKDFYFEWS